ncbi:MAG: family 10 glycosylhydrolase [candidate division FCPU426 bacterium]
MKKTALILALMLAASSARAQKLDDFSYADSAALQKAWVAQGDSKKPLASIGGDMVRAGRMTCDFSAIKDWRVYWDRDLKVDLSQSEQITVKLRCPDPTAVGFVALYFLSGKGWYHMPPFSVGTAWETKVLTLASATTEGKPLGWDKVERVRLAFMPGAKRDTYVEVADISARSGWPLSHIGAMGGYTDLASAQKGLSILAKGKPVAREVAASLKAASILAKEAYREKDKSKGQALILKGREKVAQAYALVQEPKLGEFRGVWIHHGDGPSGVTDARAQTWKEAIPALKAAGFNAILPNVLWSGVAFYPSKVVPVFEGVQREGDYLAEIIALAHPLGMKVHAWKVMWQFAEGWIAPKGVSEPFRKAGRLQMDFNGKEQPWLCPSRPENREYEKKAITELLTHYDVDGIHLDYIRYGGTQVCYCGVCRKKFEKQAGKVKDWPKDVGPGGARYEAYADFKRENITSMVREIHALVKKIKPSAELSAAVFSYPALARDSVSQDWGVWAKEGLLDWVATMTYTQDAAGFRDAVAAQKLLCDGKIRLYPGIQVTYDDGQTLALESFVDQVKSVREQGLGGYVLFEWRKSYQDRMSPFVSRGLQSK